MGLRAQKPGARAAEAQAAPGPLPGSTRLTGSWPWPGSASCCYGRAQPTGVPKSSWVWTRLEGEVRAQVRQEGVSFCQEPPGTRRHQAQSPPKVLPPSGNCISALCWGTFQRLPVPTPSSVWARQGMPTPSLPPSMAPFADEAWGAGHCPQVSVQTKGPGPAWEGERAWGILSPADGPGLARPSAEEPQARCRMPTRL